MRLDKYLADMAIGTRSELKKAIRRGDAAVDGEVITDPGYAVTKENRVFWRGEPVLYEETVYYMLNKPSGVLSATEDKKQKTVLDLLQKKNRKDLFPVGRLDRDTEGLLLITNDGKLAHRLLAPKFHVDKVYFARVNGFCTAEDVEKFAGGLYVDKTLTAMPAELEILSRNAETRTSEVRVTIREGKFHQVKRMFLAVGKEVLYLKRLSMGPLKLDEKLLPGEYRPLTPVEIRSLEAQAGWKVQHKEKQKKENN